MISSFKILGILKSNLKPKKMLFFVVRLSHYCEFKVMCFAINHFFDHRSTTTMYCQKCVVSCANINYFISVLVAFGGRFNTASKTKIHQRMSIHFFIKSFLKNDPLSLDPYNIDENNQPLKLLLLTAAIKLQCFTWISKL